MEINIYLAHNPTEIDVNGLYNGLCRICLKERLNLVPFLATETAEMLRYCEFWEPTDYGSFFNHICQECVLKITQAYELKKLCITSKEYLESLTNIESTENYLNLEKDCENIVEKDCRNIEKIIDTITELDKDEDKDCQQQIKRSEENIVLFLEFRCSYCNDTFESDTQLLNHDAVCAHKEIGDFPKTEINLENKKVIKPISGQYQCDKCTNRYFNKSDLQIHQSAHSIDLRCNQCGKQFPNVKSLKRHLKTHMTIKDYLCEECDKSFTESGALLKHKRRVHLNIPVKKKYQCPHCGQGFPDKYYLDIHIKMHTGERNIVCEVCEKTFYDPRSLWSHMKSHRGEKSYQCSECLKSFSQAHSLHTHTRSKHTGEKPHSCDVCQRGFVTTSHLKKHIKQVHVRQELHKQQLKRALEEAVQDLRS